jgi:hypothetical protein
MYRKLRKPSVGDQVLTFVCGALGIAFGVLLMLSMGPSF